MTSIRARLVNLALPLLGVKRFFAQREKLPERIAKLRQAKPVRPRAKWHKRFAISEFATRGYPVVTITPIGGAQPGAPHLLYLHGGGYVMDIAAVHWDAVMDLCERLGASATVPIYPLAPEHTAPEVLDKMEALYRNLAEQYGAANITVMGDSAGGGMTLALAQMLKDLMESGKNVAFSLNDEDLAQRLLGMLKETYAQAVAVIHAVAPAAEAPGNASLALALSTNVTSMTQSIKAVLSALPTPIDGGGASGASGAGNSVVLPKQNSLDLGKMKSVITEVSDLTLDIDGIAQSIDAERDPERKNLFLQINEDINAGVQKLVEASRQWAGDKQNPVLVRALIDEVYSVETITKNALTVALRDTEISDIRDAANAAAFSATVHAANPSLAGFLQGVASLTKIIIELLRSVASDPTFVDAHVSAVSTAMSTVVEAGRAVVAEETNAEARDRLEAHTSSMEAAVQIMSQLAQHCAANPSDTVSDRTLNARGGEYAAAIRGLVEEATGRRKRDEAKSKVKAELARKEEMLREQRRAEQERKELQRQERLAKQKAIRERRIAKARSSPMTRLATMPSRSRGAATLNPRLRRPRRRPRARRPLPVATGPAHRAQARIRAPATDRDRRARARAQARTRAWTPAMRRAQSR